MLRGYVRGERGRKLRSELAARHPGRCADEIEDAVQTACKRFLDKAEGISAPGQVYSWIRTTAHRQLNRCDDRCDREVVVDPLEGSLARAVAEDATPEEELIANEDEADLAGLVREVASCLPERRRNVLALYGTGCSRRQIASRLGMNEGRVKRDLLEIMDEARSALARRAGGGCLRGERLVMRFACGLTTPAESDQARRHLSRCRRCEHFSERLSAWREKAPAVLPALAADQATPGVLDRVAQKSVDGLSSLKHQILDGGAQLKQQAAASYYRAVDPTPLVAARPGTVAAVVAGCITLGSGATYCAQQGVDPLGAARGLIAATEESDPPPASPQPQPAESSPAEPPVSEEPPVAETAPPTEVEQPAPEPPPPPPEQTFEPASPQYQASASAASESSSPASTPAPAPAGGASEFGGP